MMMSTYQNSRTETFEYVSENKFGIWKCVCEWKNEPSKKIDNGRQTLAQSQIRWTNILVRMRS